MIARRRAASDVDYEWDGEGSAIISPSGVSHIPDIGLKGGKLLGNTLQVTNGVKVSVKNR